MKTLYYHIQGRVQGVGFRYFTKEIALQHDVFGWVRNRNDGTVDGILQGNEQNLTDVLVLLQEGPLFSKVKKLESKEITTDETFSDFTIHY